MKAIAYYQSLPIDHAEALLDVELPAPQPGPRDLLVRVMAISVNPVDTKIRRNVSPGAGEAKVLGWDVAGEVLEVGAEVRQFRPGDKVFYAGAIDRAGANSELHVVDERIVGRMPGSLDFARAAALPLTAITAWELLFERLGVREGKGDERQSLLVIGAGQISRYLAQMAQALDLGHGVARELLGTGQQDRRRIPGNAMQLEESHVEPGAEPRFQFAVKRAQRRIFLQETQQIGPHVDKKLDPLRNRVELGEDAQTR